MSQDPGTPGTVPWIAGEADVYSQTNMAIILYIGFDPSPNQYVDVPYWNQTSLPLPNFGVCVGPCDVQDLVDDGEDAESFKPRDSAGEADEFLVEVFEGWISQWGDIQ